MTRPALTALLLLMLLAPALPALADDAPVEVWIEAVPTEGMVRFQALARAERDLDLTYKLWATKQGPAGTSRHNQSGRVELRAGQAATLSRLGLSLPRGAACRLEVRVFDGSRQVGMAELTYPEPAP